MMKDPAQNLVQVGLLAELLKVHDAKVVGAAILIYSAGGSDFLEEEGMRMACRSDHIWIRHQDAIRYVLGQIEQVARPIRDLAQGDLRAV